jgi:uncharacterized protein DUF1344
MFRYLMTVVALTLVFVAATAWAVEIEGRVQSIDVAERSLILDNGTKIWLADTVAVDGVQAGAEVTVSYEDKDGKPVATSVETK